VFGVLREHETGAMSDADNLKICATTDRTYRDVLGKLSAEVGVQAGSTRIRVLCVEDNQLVADAIARKLDGDPDFEWLGWVSTSDALMEAVSRTPPDVVCMDLDVPGQDTFAMVRDLAEKCPAARVLILSGHIRQDYIDRALNAGAWGYLCKGEESRVIVDGIRRVAAGECVLGTIVRETFQGPIPARPSPAPPAAAAHPQAEEGRWNAVEVVRRVIRRLSNSP